MPSRKIKKTLFGIFWKSDLNFIIFGAGYIFITCFLIKRAYRALTYADYACSMDALLSGMDILSYLHFPLMFLAAANFFTLEVRTPFDEVLDKASVIYRDHTKRGILLRMNGLICLFFVCMQMIYLACLSIFSFHYLINSVFHVLYIFGGVGLLSIELGVLLAKIPKRNIRFLLFIALNFLLGYPLLWLNNNILFWWTKSFDRAPIRYMFMEIWNVLPDGLMCSSDGYGLYAIEVHKFALLFSWVLGCHLCNALLYHFYKKNSKVFAISAALVLCLGCSLLPYGKIDGVGQRTFNKYMMKDERISVQEQYEEEPEPTYFEVDSYSMDFYVSVNLYAKVEAVVSETDLDTYCFTLLKGYHVLSVKNQDNVGLDFKQKEDFLYIDAAGGNTCSLTIEYFGSSAPLYADLNGIYLPAGVPFFPMPGRNDVYVRGRMNSVCYNEKHFPDTEFEVNVHTLGKVYSSLEEVGNNQFRGRSDGFFLLAGTVFTNEVDGVTFYYPAGTYRYIPKPDMIKQQKRFVQGMDALFKSHGKPPLKGKKVLVMWFTYYDDMLALFDDFVGVDFILMDDDVEELYQELLGASEQ